MEKETRNKIKNGCNFDEDIQILCQPEETTSLHAYTELKEREELEDR